MLRESLLVLRDLSTAPWSVLLTSGPVLTISVILITILLFCALHKLTVQQRVPHIREGDGSGEAQSEEKSKEYPSRYPAVDYWRGMCISFVVMYHMVGNFRINGLIPSGFRGVAGVAMLQVCVGLSQALANRGRVIRWKGVVHRTMKLALFAAMLSAYTFENLLRTEQRVTVLVLAPSLLRRFYRFPESPIVFGALHCICLNSLLCLPFVKVLPFSAAITACQLLPVSILTSPCLASCSVNSIPCSSVPFPWRLTSIVPPLTSCRGSAISDSACWGSGCTTVKSTRSSLCASSPSEPEFPSKSLFFAPSADGPWWCTSAMRWCSCL
ncbi:hypothetical protein FOZ63_021154 [Perkinsus olseni]|uniref:Heparan-alpha-glucosaminide N-acetyltransferase catalytic domain-containing protein n=1 Tax=Perkinsus olseni TaxID=32597 RepID=A0A7J6SZ52_PEROL|nr:hypothetical protein FOZ63_021154 [Perkinsus olseni]